MFCQYIPDYPLECGLPIGSHTCIFIFLFLPPRATPFKKTDPAFPRSYQLTIAPQMGHPRTPFSLHAGILTGLILGSAYAGDHSCCVSISAAALPCSEDSVRLQFPQSLALIIVHLPFLQWSPKRWSRCPFCDWEPHSHLFSLYLDLVWVSVLAITYLFHRKLLWWGLRAALIYLSLKSVPYNVRGFC